MKENFLLSNYFYLFIIIVVVLVFPFFAERVSNTFISPAHMVRTWFYTSESSFAILWREKRELQDEIEDWERLWAEHSGTHASIQRLSRENTELRALMGEQTTEKILASVIGRPNSLPYDVYMINKGSQDGVLKHAPVFFRYDTMVGFISHVQHSYSLVTLISTPRQETTMFIIEPDVFVEAEGFGGGWVRLRVPQGVEIEEGNSVVAAMAPQAVIGQIERIETTSTQPEQYAFVSLPQSVFSTQYLAVGTEAMKQREFDEVLEGIEITSREVLRLDIPSEFDISATTSTSTPVATSTEAE